MSEKPKPSQVSAEDHAALTRDRGSGMIAAMRTKYAGNPQALYEIAAYEMGPEYNTLYTKTLEAYRSGDSAAIQAANKEFEEYKKKMGVSD